MKPICRAHGPVEPARGGLRSALVAFLAALLPATLLAEEWILVGPRAAGMGGAGVASTRGGYAMYWNPASLAMGPWYGDEEAEGDDDEDDTPATTESASRETAGESERETGSKPAGLPFFDMALHVSATEAAVGGVLPKISLINDLVEQLDFDAIEAKFQAGTGLTPEEIQTALELLTEAVPSLDERGEGMYLTAASGLGMRSWRVGLNLLTLGYGGAQPVIDLVGNIALGNQGIDTILSTLPAPNPGDLNTASQGFADDLAGQGLISQADAEKLLLQAQTAGINTSDPTFQSTVTDILEATQNADTSGGGGDLDLASALTNNQSGARLRGILLNEVGVGYAQPIGRWLSLGASLRLIYALSYVDPFTLSDLTGENDFFDDLFDENNRAESFNVAVDLGVLLRPAPWLILGLTGKNLNRPEFDFASGPDFHLDPQARAGVALLPFRWLTLSADLDLFTNHSDVLPGFDSQFVGGGAEVNLFDILFLRGGLSKNLRDSDESLLLHAGLGLRIWHFSVEAAAVVPSDLAELDRLSDLQERIDEIEDLPERVGLSAMLGFNIPF